MNLRNIANAATRAINPNTTVTWMQSTGSTTNADFTRTPTYTSTTIAAQIQALTGKDIERLNFLGIQGVVRKAYVNGDVEAIVRSAGQGGDLLVFGGVTWLVAAVLEHWPDWCCLGLTQQLDT